MATSRPREVYYPGIPVFGFEDLPFGGSKYGYSLYRNVLVAWDEDFDTRPLALIDCMADDDRDQLLAISEHEGVVALRWKHRVPETYPDGGTIEVDHPGFHDIWTIQESRTVASSSGDG